IKPLMDVEKALTYMKDAAIKSYSKKGDKVVNMNIAAIEKGAELVMRVSIPEDWKDVVVEEEVEDETLPEVVRKIANPINRQHGDDLPVSAFKGYEDGVIDLGLTAYEKRGIAVKIPSWDKENCIQCNQCAFVCPHAAIRPFLLTEQEAKNAPEGFETLEAHGIKDKNLLFTMQIDAFDCTGCGSCSNVCPSKQKALKMVDYTLDVSMLETWNYALSLSDKGDVFNPNTVKGSQFRTPLIEFSAACAGCGETPYAKLLTQLYGDRVYWANATGCSQAWGSPMPGIPYTKNKRGFGPAWTNSLFENNAELELGLYLSIQQQRALEKMRVEKLMNVADGSLKEACEVWLNEFNDALHTRQLSDDLIAECESSDLVEAKEVLKYKDQLAKKTFWMYGGDGWAYDIGFGGLDHVIAQGENINVLIVDTEVYSNTGGQSSKATPVGAVAQFASSGKKSRKKDLGAILMSYGNVYVAQVAMGANQAQLVKAITEAESYDGPSVIIAYSPCTAHGIKGGMHKVQDEMKRAVDSGYWFLYRYDPRKETPMQLDSKAPSMDFYEFLDGENRYASLKKSFPENAEELFAIGSEDSKRRYDKYLKMSKD
ncbi:MAG: 4Fe-4S binding protein, partial [Holdemanella sp.]|nr:4Fe-4S binding protein [Holdemanella sp.]